LSHKADILLHPVRMKIVRSLMSQRTNGLTPLQMVKVIKDVPQATLYRHIKVLEEENIIQVIKEEKIRAVTEKYYVLNEENAQINPEEWNSYSPADKLNFYSYYQLLLTNMYEDYLYQLDESKSDVSSFTIADLHLDTDEFHALQNELNELMKKYYHKSNTNKEKRTIGLTIIP